MVVSFSGSECVGKTTLLNELIKHYRAYKDFNFIGEIAREAHKIGIPLGKNTTIESSIYCANKQIQQFFELHNSKILICDRSILDSYAILLTIKELKYNQYPDYLVDFFKNLFLFEKKYFDIYFYFPIEFACSWDDIRTRDDAFRNLLDSNIKKIIEENNVKHITLSGDIETRKNTVIKYIDKN